VSKAIKTKKFGYIRRGEVYPKSTISNEMVTKTANMYP
jgi:hypothetical protein